jgi:predicted PurR-regulated permease PerM
MAVDDGHLRLLVIDARLFTWIAAIVFAIGFLWIIRGVLVTLLFVAVLSFVGAPVVERLQARMPRSAGAGIVVLTAVLVIVALFALVVPALVNDLVKLFQDTPAALKELADFVQRRFGIVIPTTISDLSSEASRELLETILPFAKGGGAIVKTSAVGVLKGVGGALAFIAQLLLIPVLTFFVLTELPRVKVVLRNLTPLGARPILDYYLPRVNHTLSKLVRGQLLVASIMMVIYVVGLSIFGVPLALAIGVLAGAAYLIPFATGAVCLSLSVLFSLLELKGDAGPKILGALVVVVVVQVAETYFLTPRIVGKEAGLSPLAAVLTVLLGAAAAGFLGVLFALPVGAVIALIIREEAQRRGGLLVEMSNPEAEAG